MQGGAMKCVDCFFYKKGAHVKDGTCFFNPPIPILEPIYSDHRKQPYVRELIDFDVQMRRGEVSEGDFCGSYKGKVGAMDWQDLTIYLDKPVKIEKALEIIDDDFEDYCQQTVIDLRDTCLNLISIIEEYEREYN